MSSRPIRCLFPPSSNSVAIGEFPVDFLGESPRVLTRVETTPQTGIHWLATHLNQHIFHQKGELSTFRCVLT